MKMRKGRAERVEGERNGEGKEREIGRKESERR